MRNIFRLKSSMRIGKYVEWVARICLNVWCILGIMCMSSSCVGIYTCMRIIIIIGVRGLLAIVVICR